LASCPVSATEENFVPFNQAIDPGDLGFGSGLGWANQVDLAEYRNGTYSWFRQPATLDPFGIAGRNPFASVDTQTNSLIKGALTNYLANPGRFNSSSVISTIPALPDHTWASLFSSPKVYYIGCG
ncbi:MAG: hypothetical protein LUQ25_02245, partial [Methanoregulaceae archaeon]|nr:hypothetical protein [Methanoregulaceae archaeon]